MFLISNTKAMAERQLVYVAIGLSSLTFFLGLLISGAFFYAGKDFDWTAAIISDLQSPEENPRGYLASATATALTGLFFLPLLRIFHRWLRTHSTSIAGTGSALFGLGATGALAIGCLAPFPVSYESVHIPLAFATFICIVAGIGVYLFLVIKLVWPTDKRRGAFLWGCLVFKLLVLAALVRIYFIPDFFRGDSLLTTLALWEWALCGSIAGYLLLLARTYNQQIVRTSTCL
jgi:hypothetical protein